MAPPENRDSLLARAEDDLRAAEILRREDDEMTMIICFHLQQYVEKTIKAKLDEIGIKYPPKHNISTLLTLFPEGNLATKLFDESSALSDYATSARYDSVVPTIEQMEYAFNQAKRIVEAVEDFVNSTKADD